MAKFCKQDPWDTDRKGRGRLSEGCHQASKPWALVMCPAQDCAGEDLWQATNYQETLGATVWFDDVCSLPVTCCVSST